MLNKGMIFVVVPVGLIIGAKMIAKKAIGQALENKHWRNHKEIIRARQNRNRPIEVVDIKRA